LEELNPALKNKENLRLEMGEGLFFETTQPCRVILIYYGCKI